MSVPKRPAEWTRDMKKLTSVRHSLKFLVKVIVSMTLMIWLLSKTDINQITDHWREINWILLILVIPVIHLICIVLRSLRLRTILKSLGLGIPLWWLGLTQLKGTFMVSFLPGGVSGDIYRAYVIARKTGHEHESISSILVEKVIGVASMLLMSLTSLFYAMYWISQTVFRPLEQPVLLASGVFLAACIILTVTVNTGLINRIQLSSSLWIKFKKILGQISYSFTKRWDLLKMAVLSLLLQIGIVAWYFTISSAIEFKLSFLVFMITIPLIELLLMLPISIGGIGVRDVAFVVLFAPFGLTMADAISFSLLSFTIAMTTRILSGMAFLFEFDHRPSVTNTDVLKHGSH